MNKIEQLKKEFEITQLEDRLEMVVFTDVQDVEGEDTGLCSCCGISGSSN
ncbi:hypothetical protein [uncultured Tenacibaculum sp.]|nr:hypothetical protein [uncultured Tenacibaculum sp.]